MEDSTEYYIYRLSFKSYLSELAAQVSYKMLEQIREYMLQHLVDITLVDGNGERTTAFGSANFGELGYVTIEKRTKHTLDKPNCKEQVLIDDYPDFNLVVDGRSLQAHGILLAIEYRRKCFVNIDTVRKGLEKYFNRVLGKEFTVEVMLRQISSSEKFWQHLEDKITEGAQLSALQLEINSVNEAELVDGLTAEKAVFYSSLLSMLTDMGADDGKLSFRAKKSKALDLERAKYNLGMMVALSCKKGFVVKARLKDERSWIRSDETAPVSYRLDRSVVFRPDDTDEDKENINKRQFEALARWFDNIYIDLERIEKEKDNEETRHITER